MKKIKLGRPENPTTSSTGSFLYPISSRKYVRNRAERMSFIYLEAVEVHHWYVALRQ